MSIISTSGYLNNVRELLCNPFLKFKPHKCAIHYLNFELLSTRYLPTYLQLFCTAEYLV